MLRTLIENFFACSDGDSFPSCRAASYSKLRGLPVAQLLRECVCVRAFDEERETSSSSGGGSLSAPVRQCLCVVLGFACLRLWSDFPPFFLLLFLEDGGTVPTKILTSGARSRSRRGTRKKAASFSIFGPIPDGCSGGGGRKGWGNSAASFFEHQKRSSSSRFLLSFFLSFFLFLLLQETDNHRRCLTTFSSLVFAFFELYLCILSILLSAILLSAILLYSILPF